MRKQVIYLQCLKGLPSAIVGDRQLRTKYFTNRSIKALDLFLVLRGLTYSNKLQQWKKQLPHLLQVSKIRSKDTFRTRLRLAEQLGFLEFSETEIRFSSWRKIAERYGIDRIEFHQFKYLEDEKHCARYLLMALEIKENKEKQHFAFNDRYSKNPHVARALTDRFGIPFKQKNTRERLLTLQGISLHSRSEDDRLLFAFNPDDNRSVPTIRRAHGYKSNRSVYDLKRQLVKRGLATVRARATRSKNGAWCNGRWHTVYGAAADPLTALEKKKPVMNMNNRSRLTVLPDQITLNAAIFGR